MKSIWLGLAISLIAFEANGQAFNAATDPQAQALAMQTITALVGQQPVHDVTLTGTTQSQSGFGQPGTATLKACGVGESRLELITSAGTRTEIRDASAGIPRGKWADESGKSGLYAVHNIMTDSVWFFPAFGSLAGGTNVVLSYVGDEEFRDHAVHHLRSYTLTSLWPSAAHPSQQDLSTVDYYIDVATSLPVATVFNQHPDNDAHVNFVTEIDFSNYQTVAGIDVPMQIWRSVNGTAELEIDLTGVQVNTGLTAADFSIE
jgi:hypothetical protein